jgi:hypothetical protein
MVCYEVSLQPTAEIAREYLTWLKTHMRQMLELDGFVDAELWQVSEPSPSGDGPTYIAQYRLRDRASLDAYLANHASQMRAEGEKLFSGRFKASRRILVTPSP